MRIDASNNTVLSSTIKAQHKIRQLTETARWCYTYLASCNLKLFNRGTVGAVATATAKEIIATSNYSTVDSGWIDNRDRMNRQCGMAGGAECESERHTNDGALSYESFKLPRILLRGCTVTVSTSLSFCRRGLRCRFWRDTLKKSISGSPGSLSSSATPSPPIAARAVAQIFNFKFAMRSADLHIRPCSNRINSGRWFASS
jgi:hypothetical protein